LASTRRTYYSYVPSALLSDGTELLIRPIRPDDKASLAAGMVRLSDASRTRRFLSLKPRLTSAELRYLTEVDGTDHYAIVAVLAGEVAAVARWVREAEDPTTAEAAIVVCDALQGKGLGKQLARLLADAARERGVRRIRASMLTDNPPAFALMRVIADRLTDGGYDQGVHEVFAELGAAAA
jgi:acetyltransferase